MEKNDFRPFGIFASSCALAFLGAVSAGSAVCFFELILNNAPALRAGNNVIISRALHDLAWGRLSARRSDTGRR